MLEIILGFDSRKAKEARRNPSCPVSDLFRLNGRTIIGVSKTHFLSNECEGAHLPLLKLVL